MEQAAVTVLYGALVAPEESTTCAVKFNAPAFVGVPVIAPVLALRLNGDMEPVIE
jgi:hypothetical protein